MNSNGQVGTDQGGEFFEGRRGDAGHGAITQQQALLRLRPHPADFPQGALDGRLGTQVPVEGDAEAVRLVPDVLENLQRL